MKSKNKCYSYVQYETGAFYTVWLISFYELWILENELIFHCFNEQGCTVNDLTHKIQCFKHWHGSFEIIKQVLK